MGSFSFTRQERRGILYIAIIVLFTIVFRYSLPYFIVDEVDFETANFEKEIKNFENRQLKITQQIEAEKQQYKKQRYVNNYSNNKYKNYSNYKNNKKTNYYKFDPNKASIKDWKNFGFSIKQSKIIMKFIKKSGGITAKSDLKKIFVIDEKKYRELFPFIKIENIKKETEKITNIEVKNKIELNTATQEQLIQIKGIGNKTAGRIIKYRNILGGFYSLTQLNEVYGISEENYLKMKLELKVNRLEIKKINVNFADKKELAGNPYISFEQAKNIIKYKVNNGAFKSVNELYVNNLIKDEKLRYYLTIE